MFAHDIRAFLLIYSDYSTA